MIPTGMFMWMEITLMRFLPGAIPGTIPTGLTVGQAPGVCRLVIVHGDIHPTAVGMAMVITILSTAPIITDGVTITHLIMVMGTTIQTIITDTMEVQETTTEEILKEA